MLVFHGVTHAKFVEVVRFLSWRDGNLADIARAIADEPYESWSGGATMGVMFIGDAPAVVYKTISERVLIWNSSANEMYALHMDESVNLRGALEELLGTAQVLQDERGLLSSTPPVYIVREETPCDDCGVTTWRAQFVQKRDEKLNSMVVGAIAQIEIENGGEA